MTQKHRETQRTDNFHFILRVISLCSIQALSSRYTLPKNTKMKKSPVIRITKQFGFEAAHVLWGHDGKCKNIHGHNYQLFVTVSGMPVNDVSNPKYGMVLDFSELKTIINELIIKPFDHSLIVNENIPLFKQSETVKLPGKTIPLPYQPTCENMVADFANRIKSKLPKHIKLHSLKLYETPAACAEWHTSDNQE